MDPFLSFFKRLWAGWLALGVFVSVVTLAWLGYGAISEWQRSATLLAQRRADAAVDLLVTAITRDMRGVQTSELSSPRFDGVRAGVGTDLNGVGSAFARYPYPEAFFASRGQLGSNSMVFYSRADRPPAWLTTHVSQNRFPVAMGTEPAMSRLLLDRIARDAAKGRRFATCGITLQGSKYQIVALLSYADPGRERLDAVFGFIVNLDWVRHHYLVELAAQVTSIQGSDDGLVLTILDATGIPVVGHLVAGTGTPSSRRQFPMLFFDPSLVALDPPADLDLAPWTAAATVSRDRALVAAQLGTRWAVGIAAISALGLAVGFVLTVQATRANARLVAMRSDFVSAVTHEIKTPIATIRALCETLASGRSSNPEMSREYAQLSVHEAKRLTRLVDNLLAYARITDVTDAYAFEPVPVAVIAQQSLKDFSSQLTTGGFSVRIDIPIDLPPVRADRASMMLAFGNLLDNAIRYSTASRQLTIGAHASNGTVVVEVTDAGAGIPESEIKHVTRKFFRGNGAVSGGSGLGLSIAQRIVSDHSGSMSIRSEVGVGTTVSITLPSALVDDEEANPGS